MVGLASDVAKAASYNLCVFTLLPFQTDVYTPPVSMPNGPRTFICLVCDEMPGWLPNPWYLDN